MGNSASKSPSAQYISNPGPLKGSDQAPDIHRRATTHATNHSSSSGGSHRRARSTIVAPQRQSQLPPPSYQEALATPTETNNNSFLNVPIDQGPLLQPRSRSQDPSQNRNPFRQRPLSFNGVPQNSAAAPVASSSPSHPTAAARSSRRTNTAEQERLEYLRRPLRQESYENALEILRKYNTVIVVDDSSSMTKDGRWQEARNALAALAETAADYDADGIDVAFLNSRKEGKNMKSSAHVQRLFDSVYPNGLTPIGETMDKLLRAYLNELDAAKRAGREESVRPINYIVLTDGAATDDPADVIVNAARRLDKGGYLLSQVGIQFVQIGDDRNATEFLRQLDDDIASDKGVRDIVDTTPYLGGQISAETIIKILLGGINRRVDRRGGRSVMSN